MGTEILADEPRYDVGQRFATLTTEPYAHDILVRHSLWWGIVAARANVHRLLVESDLEPALDEGFDEHCEPLIELFHAVVDPIIVAILVWLGLLPSDQSWRLWPRIVQLLSGMGERPPFSGPHLEYWVAPESRRYHHNPAHLRGAGARCIGGRLPPYAPHTARALEYRPEKWGGGPWYYQA